MACGTFLQNMAQPSDSYVEHDPWYTHPSSTLSSSSTSSISSSSTYKHTSSEYIRPSSSSTYTHTYTPSSSSSQCMPSSSTYTPTTSASSIDWLAPRISFSGDFARPGAHSAPHETMKEISEISESPARVSSSKSSPSEFEFSMSFQGPDSSYEHTMLAADELFYEGKLLPLYNTSQGAPIQECIVSRRRSSAEEYAMLTHSDHVSELSRGKVEHNPISPKAPTCTSRWRELLGLKKVQIQDVSHGGKLQKKSLHSGNGLAPGRRSVDSLKDPKMGLSRAEARLNYCIKEPKPNLPHGDIHAHHSIKETKPTSSHGETRMHTIQAQNHGNGSHLSSVAMQSELSVADPGICPTTNLQTWQMDRGMSGSRSSKSSEDSEGPVMEAGQMQSNGGGQAPMVKQRNKAKSPTKQTEQARVNSPVMSPRRGRGGPKGMSPVRPSAGVRQTETSRSAIATRLVVRGLDRSCSSPKLLRKRPEQLRSGRQRTSADTSRSLERSTSYSAGVRVTPVINVPMYITPGLRKGSKNGIFGLTQLFSSKKDKVPNKLSSSAAHHHHAQVDG